MNRAQGRGRPSYSLVNREKIAEAALAIIHRLGYDKLTMARIAEQIGVSPSALYNHVSGKHELLLLVEDTVMGQVDTSPLYRALDGTITPRDALAAWAESYRDVFARHSPLVSVIAHAPISGAPRAVAMYELVARVYVRAGVPTEEVLPRIVMLESFIYGSAFDVHAPADLFRVPESAGFDAPTLDAAHRAAPTGPEEERESDRNPYADAPFRLGLRALLRDVADEGCAGGS
ncbi:TetR/AcrR family transcriptional regulator [Corynebacterium sp. zg-331]|uniref:TetR/AcrR family transcriptional regulator n=1 Tax=unclassified Corynebacterium TaxID=2624378 RepID=UPI00128D5C08|nr:MULTISPECIES: TetR/AcrR family transcriptional regulator [unclassified Corynebacterium]MBC3186111.1 TetR/AcrR family transcriptional regulator [Corynebacterium sp. zg-331]MPV52601.1 TetR family transcriptional regulator [Corynebacterium sp. zg331]